MVCFFYTNPGIQSPKTIHYAASYHFNRDHCCGRFALAGKHLYPHGQEDQKHPQCRGSDHIGDLAAESIRGIQFPGIGSGLSSEGG